MEKTTKRDTFVAIQDYLTENGQTEFADFITHEIALYDKKSAYKSKSVSASKKISMGMTDDVLACLDDKGMTITDICSAVRAYKENYGDVTTQRITSVCNELMKAGKVKREVVGKNPIFTKVEG